MAIVSKDYNFIFIHIFKCGGNSVRRALGAPSVGSQVDHLKAGEMMGAHVDIQDIHHHHLKHDDMDFFNNAFKFAFVRNPFDWLLSTYYYIKCSKGHNFHKRVSSMNLYQFLNWYVKEAMCMDRPFGSNKYLNMKDYLNDADGKILVDYIGKIEHMSDDMVHVFKTINMVPRNIDVVNKNSNKTQDWKPYYDNRCREFVETNFGKDLNMLGYTFEGESI